MYTRSSRARAGGRTTCPDGQVGPEGTPTRAQGGSVGANRKRVSDWHSHTRAGGMLLTENVPMGAPTRARARHHRYRPSVRVCAANRKAGTATLVWAIQGNAPTRGRILAARRGARGVSRSRATGDWRGRSRAGSAHRQCPAPQSVAPAGRSTSTPRPWPTSRFHSSWSVSRLATYRVSGPASCPPSAVNGARAASFRST